MTADERIWAGIERRLSAVEPLLPATPRWRAPEEPEPAPTFRIVAGPAIRREGRGYRLIPVAAAAVIVLVAGLVLVMGRDWTPGAGSLPTPSPTETASPSPLASGTPTGVLRPAIEPRLALRTEPEGWTLVEDGPDAVHLVHLLQEFGAGGLNVAAAIFEPRAVYDPVDETKRLPLPDDLIAWIADHPDLDADEPRSLVVDGLPATSIDVTVTYEPGPRGQTAQFIDIGSSWNLESPSRKRVVLLRLEDRPLLIVYDARPELFDQGLPQFVELLDTLEIQDSATP